MSGEKEIWKDYPGALRLQISNKGRVKRNGKIRKLGKDRDGYIRIAVNGKSMRLHRLIAELFCENPNPEEYTVVDHINNIKDDNRAENLRWCTPKMNTQYAGEMGVLARVQNNKAAVITIDENGIGRVYSSNVEVARELGVDPARVSVVTCGKTKSLKGYRIIRLEELIDKRVDKTKDVR